MLGPFDLWREAAAYTVCVLSIAGDEAVTSPHRGRTSETAARERAYRLRDETAAEERAYRLRDETKVRRRPV